MGLVDEEDVRSVFKEHFEYSIPDDILRECAQMCNSYAKTPEDLVFKWQSICINQRTGVTGGGLRPLDSTGVTLMKKEFQKGIQVIQARKAGNVNTRRQQVRPQPRQSLPQAIRQPAALIKSDPNGLTLHDKLDERHYRYMHERLTERSTVLDDRIDEFAEWVREHYKLEDIGDPASSTDEPQVVVGRICSEDDMRLTEQSVFLETSRLMGAGARVRLKFDPDVSANGKNTLYPIFPGAIIALKGNNETGEHFQVSEILSLPLLSPNTASSLQLRPISMVVASGPFSLDSDLSYTPFSTFLNQIRSAPPSWLLLLGPFVDANHSSIKIGDVDLAPADLFKTRILGPLRAFLDDAPGTTVLIVPSVRDLISHHTVFPQPALPLPQSDRIMFLPNPCTFTIDHVRFAATSTDTFFHLQSQILRKKVVPTEAAIPPDNMATLASCILEQRSLYPLFPAHEGGSTDVNLDVSHSKMLEITEVAPDVLIVPSALKQFHKVLHGTAVINPSFTSKGVYATIRIPDARSTHSDGTFSTADRVAVQLHASASTTKYST